MSPSSSIACDPCRQRKVKCDKLKPCSQCRRRNTFCHVSHDGVRPRGRLGGRAGNRESIQARLARVEELLENLEHVKDGSVQQIPTPEASIDPLPHEDEIDKTVDKLHRYVAGPVWSQLSQQIQGLRDVLLHSSDEEDNSKTLPGSIASPVASAHFNIFLSNSPANMTTSSHSFEHPSPSVKEKLFTTFCSNVDPIFKIIHRPTMKEQLSQVNSIGYDTQDAAAIHATCFAMYAAAIISLPTQKVAAGITPNLSHDLQRFCTATEYFLSTANYLNSRNLQTFQAFLIYLLVVRTQDAGQKHWVLLGLAVQLARGLGLHSAATTSTFKPLQRELRLRLWQVLRNLDFRAAIDRGVDPIIRVDSYDTPAPTNLNDTDLTEDMLSLPPARAEITYVSFGSVPDQGITLAAKLQYLDITRDESDHGDVWEYRRKLVQNFDETINAACVVRCDMSVPVQWVMTYTAHAMSKICHLLAVRPMTRLHKSKYPPPITSPQGILSLALDSLRAEELFYQTSLVKGFWWCTWNHWYVLAVALVEICAMPSMCQDEDTWAVLQQAYERQSKTIADTTHGQLWRPMTKLMDRVRDLRASQVEALDPVSTVNYPASSLTHSDIQPDAIDSITLANCQNATPFTTASLANFDATNSNQPQLPQDGFMATESSMVFWDEFLTNFNSYPSDEAWIWGTE